MAGALPAQATFGDAAYRSRLRELDMVERDRCKEAKATVCRWLKRGYEQKRQRAEGRQG